MSGENPLVYACDRCGASFPKRVARCACGLWNTVRAVRQSKVRPVAPFSDPVFQREKVRSFAVGEADGGIVERLGTGSRELDIVLGGGMAKGAAYLVVGDPGAGKSTLLSQVGAFVASAGSRVLNCSGEETTGQISERAARLGLRADPNHRMARSSYLEEIEELISADRPDILVIDSLQTLTDGGGGGNARIERVCKRLVDLVKSDGLTLFLVCHVNKKGDANGPKFTEHLLDCTLKLGHPNKKVLTAERVLSIPGKNRYGSATETGKFTMTPTGLVGARDVKAEAIEGEAVQ